MKNIEFPKVEGVSIVIARQEPDENPGQTEWMAYVINTNPFPIVNVLVATKGYGEVGGEQQKTSILRHLIDRVEPGGSAPIERIDEQVLPLANEFWLSYYKDEAGSKIYDKKFVFLPDSIIEANLIYIPQLDLRGIMHD